jgi:excinuclease UvrABC nuclease subunit
MMTISLDFDGYWRDEKKEHVPQGSGIYCVYAGTYNLSSNSITIRELLYIGESDDVRSRLSNHERHKDWMRQLNSGEMVCFSVASISSSEREQAEAALIYHHKPPCNTEFRYSFPYSDTVICTSGQNMYLDERFLVTSSR